METVNRQLGAIGDLRQRAQRVVDQALWHLSAQAKNQGEITNVLGARSATAQYRYKRAHDNAKRMAFLAKRAIEQRLGIALEDMTEELPLVDTPSSWASSICTTTGIDYGKLRSGSMKRFADAYIGDYVTKLENVVESYRLTQNFHEGSDTAVVSLRDDLFNVRAECDIESPNILLHASALDTSSHDTPPIPPTEPDQLPTRTSQPGWLFRGCGLDAEGKALKDCIALTLEDQAPFVDIDPRFRAVRGFKLRFGDGGACPPATCGYRSGAHLGQDADLAPGRYRFSWYRPSGVGTAADLSGFVLVDGVEVTAPRSNVPKTDFIWARSYITFDVEKNEGEEDAKLKTVTVGFKRPGTANDFVVAAPMLERVDSIAGQTSSPNPKTFSDTTETRTSKLAVCEDTNGAVFRDKVWSRECVKLCPDGYSSDCRGRGDASCYWETSFHISQRGIEAGHIFNQSGFARGNFNYRIDSIATNFVGTTLRDCSDSDTPSTCYGGGFIPYSLIHSGPYYVGNHRGIDFEARLFTGQVEHARGLGIERYITNPIGDADRTLLEPYQRVELRGRPLDGEFTLRVWEEPGMNFHAIEDVQLVLNYRYWTRFD